MPSIPTSTVHFASAAAAALVPATNKATATTTATVSSATSTLKDSTVAFYFDIALICILAAFFLATLPRAVIRFSRLSEWGKGVVLRGGTATFNRFKNTSPRQISSPMQTHDDDDKSDDSHTLHDHSATAHTMYAYGSKSSATTDGKLASHSLPGHIQSISTLAYPVSTFFSKTVQPGTSIGQLLLQTLYTCGVIFVVFYKSNPITSPERIGFIAVSQIPVIFAFGAKNSLPGMLLGMGYEKLNWLHRFAGMTTFVLTHVHALSYVYKWVTAGTLDAELAKPNITAGLVGLIGLDILVLFTLALVRQKAYNLFSAAHIVGMIIFPVAVGFHEASAVPYVALGYILYGFDHLLRLTKTRITTARIRALPELSSTLLVVPTLRTGWRAGQHVRIRVLSREMGWFGWAESHPFTIASRPGEELALVVKKVGKGTWTESLFGAAMKAGYVQRGKDLEKGAVMTRSLTVVIEGPYGGNGHLLPESYSGAMMVAGGSGITYALSTIKDLVHKAMRGDVHTRFVELVWTIQDQSSLIPLASQLNALIEQSNSVPGFFLKVTIFYTRITPSNSDPLKTDPFRVLHTSVGVIAGRPPLNTLLGNMVEYISAVPDPKGVAVCVCGPMSLAEEVKSVVNSVDGPRRDKIGGVDLHEEVFGW